MCKGLIHVHACLHLLYNFMQSFTQIIELEKSGVCLSRTSRFSCWASNFLLSNGQGKLSPTKKNVDWGPANHQGPPRRSRTVTEGTAGLLRLSLTLPKCYLATSRIPIFLIPGLSCIFNFCAAEIVLRKISIAFFWIYADRMKLV